MVVAVVVVAVGAVVGGSVVDARSALQLLDDVAA